MLLETIIDNLKLRVYNMTIQDKVNIVLQFLYDNFWKNVDGYHVVKRLGYVSLYEPQVISAKRREILSVARKCRGMPYEELESGLDSLLSKLPKSLNYNEWTKEERANTDNVSNFFGFVRPPRYDGEDVLTLGFLPESCTSFAVLAHDLLNATGANTEVWNWTMTGYLGDHSVLHYQIDDKTWLKCDPKWQLHPDFFKDFPELKPKFIRGLEYKVHGVRRDNNGKPIEFDQSVRIK